MERHTLNKTGENQMSLLLNGNKSSSVEPMEAGVYPARVVQIIDLGRQQKYNYKTGEQELWDDGNPKISPEVRITFELPTEFVNDDPSKPRWMGKDYTVSTHQMAALTKLLQATDPTIKSLDKLIGLPLMVEVGMTSGGKNKVAGVSKLMKGMEVPELINPPVIFDVSSFDQEVYETLPPFVRDKIDNRVQ